MQDARHRGVRTGHRVGSSQSAVRVGPLYGIVTVTRELGVNPDEILDPFGLSAVQFDDPDFEIPYVIAGRLLARCAKATQCPHFGLLAGISAHPSSLGLPGFLLPNSPDVGTALRALVQNLDLHDQGGVAILEVKDKSTVLGYAIHQSNVEGIDHIYDLSIALGCSIMRQLCGARWNPTEVLLSRRQPPDLKSYRRFYRAPLRFDMARNALVFPSRWMKHTLTNADALLHRHLEQQANELHTRRRTNIVHATHRLLRTSMMSGNCTANEIATRLGMHERTLHRRLREQGTSFQLELNAVRYETARQLLDASAMPIARIAESLNYSDVSAFNRAFKRWTGFTPARWRAKNLATLKHISDDFRIDETA